MFKNLYLNQWLRIIRFYAQVTDEKTDELSENQCWADESIAFFIDRRRGPEVKEILSINLSQTQVKIRFHQTTDQGAKNGLIFWKHM